MSESPEPRRRTRSLTLPLYRHWSLMSSIKHSQLMFAALKLWTREGDSSLLKFIARVGLTRKESEQVDARVTVEAGRTVDVREST